jgi:hypothetical protein
VALGNLTVNLSDGGDSGDRDEAGFDPSGDLGATASETSQEMLFPESAEC